MCGTRSELASTVELTWALILASCRDLVGEHAAVLEGRWQGGVGSTLAGRTLGIVGLGRIGTRVAAIAGAFDMEVIAWSQNLTGDQARSSGAHAVSKDELFQASDVVTLHVRGGERSRGLVGQRELALMKATAHLVNTSRGSVVDEAALIQALGAGSIGGAALDVFAEEPLPPGHPFRTLAHVVLSPHMGYVADTNYRIFFADVVEDIARYLEGRPVRQL